MRVLTGFARRSGDATADSKERNGTGRPTPGPPAARPLARSDGHTRFQYVLEVNGGYAVAHGITAGPPVEVRDIEWKRRSRLDQRTPNGPPPPQAPGSSPGSASYRRRGRSSELYQRLPGGERPIATRRLAHAHGCCPLDE